MGRVLIARRLKPAEHSAVLIDPNVAADLMDGDPGRADPGRVIDLDKAWHGVHYLLTGTGSDASSELGLAVLGGEPVGDDVGYGPVRLLSPQQVGVVSAALGRLDGELVRSRFQTDRMRERGIYPDIWDEPGVLDDYLLPGLDDLVAFYVAAAAAGEAVLLAIV